MSALTSLISYAEHVRQERRLVRGVTTAELAAAPAHEREALSRIRGRSNELRAIRALQSTPLPIWVVHYRGAGPSEDRQGCDLVVICDDGRHYWLQLKSSTHGAVWFVAHRPAQAERIGIVVVSDHMPLPRLAGRILAAVDGMRRRFDRPGLGGSR